jgi:hypothetical protein
MALPAGPTVHLIVIQPALTFSRLEAVAVVEARYDLRRRRVGAACGLVG